MAKLMTVTLQLRVEQDGDPDDIGPLDEWDVEDVADVLSGLGESDMATELFAGSMIGAKFTACRITSSSWEDAP